MSTGPKKQKPVIVEQALNFVLLDIGCGNGLRASQWVAKDKIAHVFCFDPLAECIAQANCKAKDTSVVGRMHPFAVAVSASGGIDKRAVLHVANDMSSCSLLPFGEKAATLRWKYPPGKVHFKTVEQRDVPVIRMDKFMSDRRISRVQFCRLETQGSALDAVQSFGKRIKDVMEFAIKVHVIDYDIYDGQTKKQALLEHMNSNGFAIYGIQRQSRDQEEIIWFVNKLYSKQALQHLDYAT